MNTYSYYDDLRATDTENFSPIFGGNYVGRNLHRYEDGDGDDVVMCHVPVFMRYTQMNADGKLTEVSDLGYGASAATLLGINHWNNGNGVVVKEIEGVNESCKIRFTTEVFDTQAAAIPAIKGITKMMIRSPNSIIEPQPCAVLGTLYSSVASKFATVTGVYDLLQVAPGASSDALDNKDAYPLFSRTHPSDGGAAKLLPKFMSEVFNVHKIAVVYIADDGYGLSYLNVILDYAKANGLDILPIPLTFYPEPSKEDLKQELKVLLDSKLSYVIGVFFNNNYAPIMEAAGEIGVAGPGKMWIFCGGLAEYIYEHAQTFEKNSMLANVTYGNAVITDGGGAPGTKEYETFVEEWKKLGDNPEALSYINSKQPQSSEGGVAFDFNHTKDWFHGPPNHVAIYAYEAIIGMGISACQAALDSASTFEENEVFTGADHHNAFLNVNFRSASGEVKIGPDNFSRNGLSTYYVVANILDINSTDTSVTMKGKEYAYFDALTSSWVPYKDNGPDFIDQYIFPDGTRNAPPQIGAVEEDMNLISAGVRATCLVLAAVIIAMAIGFFTYTLRMRERPVIRMSQPPFLQMICIGTLFMALSIIPLSMDEGLLGQGGLDVSCSLFPWFSSVGFVVMFAALFSKLWRVNKVVDASQLCKRVTITVKDVMVPFGVLLTSNALILSIWQGIAPFTWERIILEENEFDQVLVSEGACRYEYSVGFGSAIIVVNGTALLLACYQAFKGREIRTEMNESKYIGMAMICIFQSFFFGLPLLFITKGNHSASLFVTTSICFVICVATLLFIFVPKIFAQRNKDNEVIKPVRKNSSTISGVSDRLVQLRAQQKAARSSKRLSNPSSDSKNEIEDDQKSESLFPIRASAGNEEVVQGRIDFPGSAKSEPDMEQGASEELY